ncbi:MAG: hypothetical protein J7L15_03585, partial [Clostridiales bacterium]|nr:hypothetical protein [Clostridiales bacterium]
MSLINIESSTGELIATDYNGEAVSDPFLQESSGDCIEYDLTPGLVAHYLLNNNSDDCHGAYDGTDTAMTYSGDKAYFDGTDTSKITTPTLDNIKTLSIWFIIDDFSKYSWILSQNEASPVPYSLLISWGSGNVLRFYVNEDEYFTIANIDDLVEGQLYNIIITVDGVTAYGYLDNVSVGSLSTSLLMDIRGFGNSVTTGRNHKGFVSNVRAYSDTKNATFRAELYAEGYNPTNVLEEPTTEGLISYYPLVNNANDEYGNNDGTESNTLYVVDSEFGSVAEFNDGYITTSNIISDYSSFGFSFWVKITVVESNLILVGYSQDDPWNGWGIGFLDTGVIRFWDSNSWVYSSNSLINNTGWINIIVNAINNDAISIYVNGIFEESLSIGSITPFSGSNNISSANSNQFLSRLRLYEKALTQNEITDIYNYEKNFRYKQELTNNLVAHYLLN